MTLTDGVHLCELLVLHGQSTQMIFTVETNSKTPVGSLEGSIFLKTR